MTVRFSIIPAQAVTDRRLEGRDLQVLALLGRHIDNLGWCRRSQVRMAKELGCARSTVQLSIERLIQAEYVEKRQESSNALGTSSFSYRVRLDLQESDAAFQQLPKPESDGEDPCRPVGTPADLSAPLPIHDRHPLPIHASAPITSPVERKDEREAPASEPEPDPESDEAFQALLRKAVTASGPQNVPRVFPLWRRLAPEEREALAARYDAIVAEQRNKGRKALFSLEAVIRGRMWEQVSAPEGDAPARTSLDLKSGEWFAAFWQAFAAADIARCKSMLRFAAMNTGAPCDLADVPPREAYAALEKVDARGEEWRAWRAALARHGLNLSFQIEQNAIPAWPWVPTKWPGGEAGSETDEREIEEARR